MVPRKNYLLNLNKSKVLKKGKDLTVISTSYMTPEIKNIYSELNSLKIDIEHIDLICAKPLDKNTIVNSVKKTGRVIILDSGFKTNSISAEIMAIINENCFKYLKNKPIRITVPDSPEPASYGLTKYYYQNKEFILKKIADILKVKIKKIYAKKVGHHDVPGKWFEGPF
jgi:pyruvate dehydrogenase E1 component beta subunit